MRILYVADVVGGAAKIHVEETCRHLARLGESVELVVNSPTEIEGVKIVRVGDAKISRASAMKILVQDTMMLSKSLFRKCDVIYTRNGFLALQMKILRPFKPVVWEINGISRLEYAQSGQPRAKTALAAFFEERLVPLFAKRIVAVTEGMRKLLVEYGVPEGKLAVVPNGVDCEKFNPLIDGSEIRENFGVKANEKLLIFVGKLAAWHGAGHMLSTFEMIARKTKDVKLMLVGIGEGEFEKFAPGISPEARSRIICAGWVDAGKIPEYIAAADAGIHLGIHDYELNPFKVLEYMACGKPVIGTKRGLSEIIRASGGGIAVDPLEHEKSADAICNFMHDGKRLAAEGKSARKYVLEKHDWKKSASLLRSILKGVIS